MHLSRVWGLILNAVLPSYHLAGFSFALGCGVSPHSGTGAAQLSLSTEQQMEGISKSLLVKAREEREKAGLKLNIQKTKILAPVPSLYGK